MTWCTWLLLALSAHLLLPATAELLLPLLCPLCAPPGQWGNYADEESLGSIISSGRTREGRVARRARRRESLAEKRQVWMEEDKAKRTMVGGRGWVGGGWVGGPKGAWWVDR